MSFFNPQNLFSRIFGNQPRSEDSTMSSKNHTPSRTDNANNDEDENESMDHSGCDLGSSRGHGKSPAPSDSSMSPSQTKKMKLNAEQSEEEDPFQGQDSEDECFEYITGSEDDFEFGSTNSDDYVGYAMSDRDIDVSSASSDDNKYLYEVLDPESIVRCMEEYIESSNSVLQLPKTIMRHLLNHFSWDKDRLCETYFAAGDSGRERLFKDAGIMNPPNQVDECSANNISNDRQEECQICFDTFPAVKMYGMQCGHRYCTDCWVHYLTIQIADEGLGQKINCLAHECEVLVDDNTVMKLLEDADILTKYRQQIANSFVLSNRLMKWCPSPNCVYALKVQHLEDHGGTVTCKCGHSFCFKCAENTHDPIWCDMLKKWLKKCADDSETCNWIAVNTKECPKCRANIQKNGGCNHMLCRNKACSMEFCWVCLGPWKNHDPYRCNRYNEEDASGARQNQEKSRAALHRYLFYFNRYANHMNSLKLENNLYDLVGNKMVDMQHHMSWIEVQFLKTAVDTLCLCRQTLMYTYVFAFYVEKVQQNSQIEIFETNQEDLQAATEKLSGYLEREVVPSDNLTEIKQNVQDMYKYCESRRQVLLKHVQEGHEKSWWKFQD